MSIQIYKPNKSNNGFAFNFSMGLERKNNEPVLYVSAIAQHSWDEKKKIGSFTANKENPEKNLNLKFNEFECGSIIDAIERRYEYSTFHKYEDIKPRLSLRHGIKILNLVNLIQAQNNTRIIIIFLHALVYLLQKMVIIHLRYP